MLIRAENLNLKIATLILLTGLKKVDICIEFWTSYERL